MQYQVDVIDPSWENYQKPNFCLKFLIKKYEGLVYGGWIYQNELKGSKTFGVCNIKSIWLTNIDKRTLMFFEKIFRKFSKCRARMLYSWWKILKVVKYDFFHDNFANWTILEHFQKIFPIQNFMDHSLNFEGHFCDFGHFWLKI